MTRPARSQNPQLYQGQVLGRVSSCLAAALRRCPGRRMTSCMASFAVASSLASLAAAASSTARRAISVTPGPGQAFRSVPHHAGYCRKHPGLQARRTARCLQPLRCLTEKAEELRVLRARSVPERLHAERRLRQPSRVADSATGVGGLQETLPGLV
jgi:hypothetical protein